MSRSLAAVVTALAVIGAFSADAEAIRNKPKPQPAKSTSSTEAQSDRALTSGLQKLDEADRTVLQNPAEARKEYEAALKDLQQAVKLSPNNYRAHSAVGYSYRRLGNYERALKSYEQALRLAPGFPDAIEYRAEAYLALNRLEDTRQAYMYLFVHDRTNAGVLMKAMKAWIEERRANPGSVSPSALASFESWVFERDTLATSTLNLGHNSPDWK
jgi:tetratricopeptide (TPR) repeat protein